MWPVDLLRSIKTRYDKNELRGSKGKRNHQEHHDLISEIRYPLSARQIRLRDD